MTRMGASCSEPSGSSFFASAAIYYNPQKNIERVINPATPEELSGRSF